MRLALRVLLVGHSGPSLSDVQGLLAERRQMSVSTRVLGVAPDPVLSSIPDPCDVIVLVLTEDWRATLSTCFKRDGVAPKPLLVVGPADDLDLLRATMRLGARDFFSLPVRGGDLIVALDRLATEEHERRGGLSAEVTTLLNAKGGSGASFLAANIAHLLAKTFAKKTILVDFELQFGSLLSYFNLKSRSGLIRALELVDALDVAALQGYVQQGPAGLVLLAATSEGLVLPEDVHEERIAKLFAVLDEAYEELVIDLPRRIDRATAAILDRSDRILLMTQQTVVDLQDAKKVSSLIMEHLDIGRERLIVVVNRYSKGGQVTLTDFEEALPGLRLETLPNDYESATKSINLGVPLVELEPRAALSRRITDLVGRLYGKVEAQPGSSLLRWPWLSRANR